MSCSWTSYSWKQGKRKDSSQEIKNQHFLFLLFGREDMWKEECRRREGEKDFGRFPSSSHLCCTKDHTVWQWDEATRLSLIRERLWNLFFHRFFLSGRPFTFQEGKKRIRKRKKFFHSCTPPFQKSHTDDEKKWRANRLLKKGSDFHVWRASCIRHQASAHAIRDPLQSSIISFSDVSLSLSLHWSPQIHTYAVCFAVSRIHAHKFRYHIPLFAPAIMPGLFLIERADWLLSEFSRNEYVCELCADLFTKHADL